mmetsp:Transcript_31103/g.47506  ORF Transcript_31103/g.47506 Transcript_31103/m.47506 type:complete len:97 (-) Transcript_31103:245-535(-)
MCRLFVLVPKDIKLRAIEIYIDSCRLVHTLAFLQWRRLYPSKLRFDKQELESLMLNQIARIKHRAKQHVVVSIHTKHAAILEKEFLEKYDLLCLEQ